jgi:hypothetical protein
LYNECEYGLLHLEFNKEILQVEKHSFLLLHRVEFPEFVVTFLYGWRRFNPFME